MERINSLIESHFISDKIFTKDFIFLNNSMSKKRGLLIILSGPSGVGKGTVRKIVMEKNNLNLVYSISLTTRERRNNEVEGKDYYFVSNEEFDRNIKEGNLLEWAEFVGNRYGTPKDKIERLRDEGKNVFLEIEVNGAKQVLDTYKNDDRVVSIYLVPPTFEDLENRIRMRSTESEEIIKERLDKAKIEMTHKGIYDFEVLNDVREKAADEIIKIIKSKI